MKQRLRVMLVEDNEDDAVLLAREITRAGYDLESLRVDTAAAMEQALAAKPWDIILSDYSMPSFGALEALAVLKASGKDIPFLIVSGTVGEETAVACLRAGARDFLVKGRLARLHSAMARELRDAQTRRERQEEERKARALELARSRAEDRLRLVIDAAPSAMIIVDAAGTMTLVNARTEQMFGYTKEELLANGVEMLLPERLRPRDPEARRTVLTHVAATVGQELFGRRRDGTEFPITVELIPFRSVEGQFLLASIADISERKRAEAALRESEERFRQIAESIKEVFWMTDVQGRQMLYISPGFEQIWGRSCQSLYENPQAWIESVHPEDRERVLDHATKTRHLGGYNATYRITRPDGTVRWIRDRAFPIRNEAGEVYRVAGIAEDITDYRVLEEQFRKAQKMEAIGTLAGGIAHDFNNMLAAIMGYAALAESAAEGRSELVDYLGEIQRAGARGADLVRQILAFSRQQEQNRVPMHLHQVVAESLKLLRATIPSTVEFRTDIAESMPPVLADGTQIHQIVMNLGTNAWHAMRDRVGTLEVTLTEIQVDAAMAATHPRLRKGRYVRLTVRDTGHGMDEATKSRIFEPFFTSKAPGEGTGLGLAVVHGIMESHEGAIVVDSDPGVGTSFHLYFPALLTNVPSLVVEDATVPRGDGQRILVIDDEEPLARLGKTMLNQLGYSADACFSSQAALDAIRGDPGRYSLVLTDLTMPQMTGLELARSIRDLRSDMPIVLLSGHGARLSSEQIAEAGILEALPKPASVHALASTVHRCLLSKARSGA